MLVDYIREYSEALSNHNESKIRKLERELRNLGVDPFTAKTMVAEYREEIGYEGNN